MSEYNYHCLPVEGNRDLVKRALEIFNSRAFDFPVNHVRYITCHIHEKEWFRKNSKVLPDDDDHKVVYSLDDLFSINEELHLLWQRQNTKLGSLL